MTDRYTILGKIAEGGMASVHLGRTIGSAGFSRLVAIKRLRAELATDKDFVAMLLDEARVTAQIRHTNVVDTLDFIAIDGVLSLVLEYVEGDALHAVVRQARREQESIPRPVAIGILLGILRGLDAAHNTRSEDGTPLGIVHRDISPQNVLVGIDGVPRIIDFGIAKAMGRSFATRPGEVRGKFSYMAPEQLLGHPATRQVDVYAAGVVLWELLTGERLFAAEDVRQIYAAVLRGRIPKPSSVVADVPPDLDDIVLRATAHSIGTRYLTAQEFLEDLSGQEAAPAEEIGAWVRRLSAERLAERQKLVQSSARVLEAAPIEEVLRELGQRQEHAREDGATASESSAGRGPKPAVFEPPSLRSDEIGTSMSVQTVAPTPPSKRGKVFTAAFLTLFALGLSWAGIQRDPSARTSDGTHATDDGVGTVDAFHGAATGVPSEDRLGGSEAAKGDRDIGPSESAAREDDVLDPVATERAMETTTTNGATNGDTTPNIAMTDGAASANRHGHAKPNPRTPPASTARTSSTSRPAAKDADASRKNGKPDPRSFR